MVAATAVDVAEIGTGTANVVPAGNLQEVLSNIHGTLVYAVTAAGEAKGTADWAAGKLGAIHYHLQQVGALVSYPVPALDAL